MMERVYEQNWPMFKFIMYIDYYINPKLLLWCFLPLIGYAIYLLYRFRPKRIK